MCHPPVWRLGALVWRSVRQAPLPCDWAKLQSFSEAWCSAQQIIVTMAVDVLFRDPENSGIQVEPGGAKIFTPTSERSDLGYRT